MRTAAAYYHARCALVTSCLLAALAAAMRLELTCCNLCGIVAAWLLTTPAPDMRTAAAYYHAQ